MNKRYLLLTLGPGTVIGKTAYMIVVEWPGWKIVEEFERKHTIYETTHKGFAGGMIDEGKLIVSTEAEVLECSLNPIRIDKVISELFFNDVHHVARGPKGIVVVNTGVDCLDLLDHQGKCYETISVVPFCKVNPSYLWDLGWKSFKKMRARRNKDSLYKHLDQRIMAPNIRKFFFPEGIRRKKIDLRQCDMRPHFAHPNHVTLHKGKYWVTLWGPGSVIRIPDGKVLATGLGNPHDGIIYDNEFFITDCRNSRLMVYSINNDVPTERRLEIVIIPSEGRGFLRGAVIVNNTIFTALSALRGDKHYPQGRILTVDRSSGDISGTWSVPPQYGNSVFSIIDVTESYQS